MADKSVFSRLRRLFSTDVVIRNVGGNQLKVIDSEVNMLTLDKTNSVNIKDGKRFDSGNYYDFYLTNTNNDTIRYINRIGQYSKILSDTNFIYIIHNI